MESSSSPSPTSTEPLSQQDLPDRSKHQQQLPPLITSTRQPPKAPSYANKRLSTFSIGATSINRSRPESTSFPVFHSSLDYTLVRDFAYQPWHPAHYGPSPDTYTADSTPIDEFPRRLSEPASNETWDDGLDPDEAAFHGVTQLPATYYGDGPPYREDDDLHSPVVTSSRHKKSKLSQNYFNFQSQTIHEEHDQERPQVYDASHQQHPGNFSTYPGPDHTAGWTDPDNSGYFEGTEYFEEEEDDEDDGEGDEDGVSADQSRFSRDYTFSIASPDEEMHGKAVALFDFARENDNELPLVEGQVLWVSYRHGQGWLVAQDPKSGESGLVPEEYVRLLRDIEGGLIGLNGQGEDQINSPVIDAIAAADTPAAATATSSSQRPSAHERSESHKSSGSGQHYETPVISHFSTSSKDLHPYPSRLLGSQSNTAMASTQETSTTSTAERPSTTAERPSTTAERPSTDIKRPVSSRSKDLSSDVS